MPVRPILILPDARLRKASEPVKAFDADLRRLIDDMFETMYAAPGIGLAAIQVGEPKRIVVMDLAKKDEEKQQTKEGAPPPPAPAPAPNVAEDAKKAADKVAGWVYEIPDYKYEGLFKPVDQLVGSK